MTTLVPASERQQEFITNLLRDKDVPDKTRESIGDPSTLTKDAATKVIDWLLKRPSVQVLNAVRDIGSYRKDGVIYRVRKSRQTGKLYAQRLDPNSQSFVYEPGLIKSLTETDRMTLEEAKAYGVQFGICCVCAAPLTDPKSVAAGIGPVCAKRV